MTNETRRRCNYEWSPDEDERLRLIWKFGYPVKVIAKNWLPNRSPDAIRTRAAFLGMPKVAEQRARYGSPEWRLVEMQLMAYPSTKRELVAGTGLGFHTVRWLLEHYADHVSTVGKKNGENVYRLGKRKSVPPFE